MGAIEVRALLFLLFSLGYAFIEDTRYAVSREAD